MEGWKDESEEWKDELDEWKDAGDAVGKRSDEV